MCLEIRFEGNKRLAPLAKSSKNDRSSFNSVGLLSRSSSDETTCHGGVSPSPNVIISLAFIGSYTPIWEVTVNNRVAAVKVQWRGFNSTRRVEEPFLLALQGKNVFSYHDGWHNHSVLVCDPCGYVPF